MAQNTGTLVSGAIRPNDSADTFPTAYANELKGGLMSVADNTERDAIPTARRQVGLEVYCADSGTVYQLHGGITNSDWRERPGGTGGDEKLTETAHALLDHTGLPGTTGRLSWINMRNDAGLLGDGSDEGAAIQAVIDAATDYATLYFPAGIWGTSESLDMTASTAIRIIGDGDATQFKALAKINAVFVNTLGSPYKKGAEYRDFNVDCNMLADCALQLEHGLKTKIDRLNIYDFLVAGLDLGADSATGVQFYEGEISNLRLYLTGSKNGMVYVGVDENGQAVYEISDEGLFNNRAEYGVLCRGWCTDGQLSNVVIAGVRTAALKIAGFMRTDNLHVFGIHLMVPAYGVWLGGNSVHTNLQIDTMPTGVRIDGPHVRISGFMQTKESATNIVLVEFNNSPDDVILNIAMIRDGWADEYIVGMPGPNCMLNGKYIGPSAEALYVDTINNRVGFGTTSPLGKFHVANSGEQGFSIYYDNFSPTNLPSVQHIMRVGRGTVETPYRVKAGDQLFSYGARTQYGASDTDTDPSTSGMTTHTKVAFRGYASEDHTATGMGTYMSILTTPNGTDEPAGVVEQVRVDHNGDLILLNGALVFPDNTSMTTAVNAPLTFSEQSESFNAVAGYAYSIVGNNSVTVSLPDIADDDRGKLIAITNLNSSSITIDNGSSDGITANGAISSSTVTLPAYSGITLCAVTASGNGNDYWCAIGQSEADDIGSTVVSDAAYGSGWNGDTTTAPSKNAVYDKIESLSVSSISAGDSSVVVTDTGTGNVSVTVDGTNTCQIAAGKVGIGPDPFTASLPQAALNVTTTGTTLRGISASQHNSSTHAALIRGAKSRGDSAASPSAISYGDGVLAILASVYVGATNSYKQCAQMGFTTFGGSGTVPDTAVATPTYFYVRTGKGATTTQQEAVLYGGMKALTDNSAVSVFEVSLAAGATQGGMITYSVHCTDGTDYQVKTGTVTFSAYNKANTVDSTMGTPSEQAVVTSSGGSTLATTWSTTDTDGATGKFAVNLNANSSLTPTSLVVHYNVHLFASGLASSGTITLL